MSSNSISISPISLKLICLRSTTASNIPRSRMIGVHCGVGGSCRVVAHFVFIGFISRSARTWSTIAESYNQHPTFSFRDYTDNYASTVPTPPSHTEDDPLFVAWSYGRRNDPQPFELIAPLLPKSH